MLYIKKIIPEPIKIIKRKVYNFINEKQIYIVQKLRKYKNVIIKNNKKGYTFYVLCIKKEIYADLVIKNINSLHYQNQNHKIVINCDLICFSYLNSKLNKINYPNQICVLNKYNLASLPWQYYKIETIIDSSIKDGILMDADGLWHDNPVIDNTKITLLVSAHKISENIQEKILINSLFRKPAWEDFNHYVTGFVSIPSKFLNENLISDLREYNDKIYNYNFKYIENNDTKEKLRRLSEELSVNITLQKYYSNKTIITLKSEDGPGNKKLFESLYYGCCNDINN